jgi:hypothetical protein
MLVAGCAGQASGVSAPGAGAAPSNDGSGGSGPAGGGSSAPLTGGSTFVQAASGGAPPAPTAGSAGGDTPSVGPDPTLFNWPEATADGGTEQLCKAGHYVGTYRCEVHPPPGFLGLSADAATGYILTGPVDLHLDEGQDGEFLQVSGGTLASTAAGILQLGATVQGKLDCLNGEFDGQLEDGTVSIPPFPSGGSFTGPMLASFSPSGPTLTGTWRLIGGTQFMGTSCGGEWSATWQGS